MGASQGKPSKPWEWGARDRREGRSRGEQLYSYASERGSRASSSTPGQWPSLAVPPPMRAANRPHSALPPSQLNAQPASTGGSGQALAVQGYASKHADPGASSSSSGAGGDAGGGTAHTGARASGQVFGVPGPTAASSASGASGNTHAGRPGPGTGTSQQAPAAQRPGIPAGSGTPAAGVQPHTSVRPSGCSGACAKAAADAAADSRRCRDAITWQRERLDKVECENRELRAFRGRYTVFEQAGQVLQGQAPGHGPLLVRLADEVLAGRLTAAQLLACLAGTEPVPQPSSSAAQTPDSTGAAAGCPPAAPASASAVWHPALVQRIAAHLPPNVVACTLRLVDRASAALLRGPQHTAVRLSQPSPPAEFAARWGAPGAARGLSLAQRQRLLALTAATGVIPNLEVALHAAGCKPDAGVAEAAGASGQLAVCRYLQGVPWWQSCNDQWTVRMACAAARAGHAYACDALVTSADPKASDWDAAVRAAARGGQLQLMQTLRQRGQEKDQHGFHLLTALAAMEGLELGSCQALFVSCRVAPGSDTTQHRPSTLLFRMQEHDKDRFLQAAGSSTTADWRAKVAWCEQLGFPRSVHVCIGAAARPDALDRLSWLRQRGYPLNAAVATAVARTGNVAALELLLAEGVRPGEETAEAAAGAGHLDFLKVLHARNCPVSERAVCAAARGAHLAALSWLVEKYRLALHLDMPRFERECVLGAGGESGSVEVLSWLAGAFGNADWSARAFKAATGSGSSAALEWLAARGAPMGEEGTAYVVAGNNGDIATLCTLRRLGCPWDATGKTINEYVHGDGANDFGCEPLVLQWLLDEGCPVDWEKVMHQSDDFDVCELLKARKARWIQEVMEM